MRLIKDVVPKGLINVITGKGSKSGDWLTKHDGFDKLAFTGSTEAGRHVGIEAVKKIIPCLN